MVPIIENLVDKSQYHLKCPYTRTPTRVVIHNTANDAPAANEIAYMSRNEYEVSFHYAVDGKEIVQGISDDRNAWASGDGHGKGNMEGIHIEICYSKSGGAKFDAAEKNAAELAAHLLKKYGWGIDRLTKHQDYDDKYCPHRTLDRGWARFVGMVQSYLDSDAKPAEPTESARYTAQVNAPSGLNVRKVPGTSYSVLRALPNVTKVTVTKEQNGWGYIGDGWISLEWVKKIADVAAPTFEPYLFRPTCDVLNIRSGPGTNYPVVGQIKDKKRYTIVEEKTGTGSAKGWGRLKAGGWVARDWIKKA